MLKALKMNLSRRLFLQTTFTSLAFPISTQLHAAAETKLPNIGFITGMLREEIKKDWKAALRKTAEMGYNEIEIGSHLGDSAEQFLQFCIEIGLTPIAGGSSMGNLLKEPQKYIEQAMALRKKYLICYWPWLTGANNLDEDECKETAENLNTIGERCTEAGLKFCFHNHDKEFRSIGVTTAFDLLMENTNPAWVYVELDLYWVKKGNADIIHYLQKYPGRYEIFHVKDMDNTPKRSFACVGEGIIDFPAIFQIALKQGIQHYIVEKDDVKNELECLRSSYEYLSSLRI